MSMEIDTIAEWDAICRICLQESQLHSLFDFDDEKSDLNIADKIMLCSPIVVRIQLATIIFFLSNTNYSNHSFHTNIHLDFERWQITGTNLHRVFMRFGCCV